jgi:hypothetical protein
MHTNELRRRLKAEPFHPFVIHMSDGRTFAVNHPELLHVFPGMERTAVLGIPEDQSTEVLSLLHITSITLAEGNGRHRRRKAG